MIVETVGGGVLPVVAALCPGVLRRCCRLGAHTAGMRSYWIYSAGLAVAWVVVLIVGATAGHHEKALALLCGGFAIGWVSTTIARYVYPPPAKWTSNRKA